MKSLFVFGIIITTVSFGIAGGPVYLPHLVAGGGYGSTIRVANLMSDEIQHVKIYFYQDSGTTWTAPTSSGDVTQLEFDVAAHATVSIVLSYPYNFLQSGWAMLMSRSPLLVSASYELSQGGVKIAVADASPATADVVSVIPAAFDKAAGTSCGLALANPSDIPANALLRLLDQQGAAISNQSVHIPARGKFIGLLGTDALFPSIGTGSLATGSGFIKVEAEQPLACLAMRTEGQVFASLPAVHDILPWRNANTVFISPTLGSNETGTGSLDAPFKTIQKGLFSTGGGWTIYLLPGLYSRDSGETFPIIFGYCRVLRGADPSSVCILGGAEYLNPSLAHTALVGQLGGMITGVTVINPLGVGLYTDAMVMIGHCRFTQCGAAGIKIDNDTPVLFENVITDNEIGVQVGELARPDLGGGSAWCYGGNVLMGNHQCDLYVMGNPPPFIRFNSWDNSTPTSSKTCTGGVDIAMPKVNESPKF